MDAYLTIEDARKIKRQPIRVGLSYYFYSDCVECKTDNGNLIRSYSGQRVFVIGHTPPAHDLDQWLFTVRAVNGDTFTANEGELNGWIFDTGQWVGPRIN